MSDASESGSYSAYRAHGDIHDAAEVIRRYREALRSFAVQSQAILGAVVVLNRDGVLEAEVSKDLAQAFSHVELLKRAKAGLEVLCDELGLVP